MNKLIFRKGIKHLLKAEPNFRKIIPNQGINFFLRPEGFVGIMFLVIEQQVSVQAAQAIKNKTSALMGNITAKSFLEIDTNKLRAAGLSRPKISYLQGIANACITRDLDFTTLHRMNDEDLRKELCKIKGIGKWTADCYLMASLSRPDIWPENDIGLQEGVKKLKNLNERPSVEDMTTIASNWRPFRSVAANLIWADYD